VGTAGGVGGAVIASAGAGGGIGGEGAAEGASPGDTLAGANDGVGSFTPSAVPTSAIIATDAGDPRPSGIGSGGVTCSGRRNRCNSRTARCSANDSATH
jgi:hypothetical protein